MVLEAHVLQSLKYLLSGSLQGKKRTEVDTNINPYHKLSPVRESCGQQQETWDTEVKINALGAVGGGTLPQGKT